MVPSNDSVKFNVIDVLSLVPSRFHDAAISSSSASLNTTVTSPASVKLGWSEHMPENTTVLPDIIPGSILISSVLSSGRRHFP